MTKMLFDTHAHLCDDSFNEDRDEVLKRAEVAGVGAILLVAENLEDARTNLKLASHNPILKPAAGLYPEFVSHQAAENMITFITENHDSLYAIGEIGLDYWLAKDDENRELQREIMIQFIELGKKTGLPLNIHSRSAGKHVVDLLLTQNAEKVQLHAFDGKWSAAMGAVEAGYFFSVPPSIVRSRQKQKLVRHLPLSCLLLESDSPVLGPEPGLRNEPANITISLQTISEIKNMPSEEVRDAIAENTTRLYNFEP